MSLRPAKTLYPHKGSKRTVAPAVEPVTADELRGYLVETDTALPDSEANALIKEARELIEENTGLGLITQTWEMALDRWPYGNGPWWDGVREGAISELYCMGDIELPKYPLQSLSSVKVFDDEGNETLAGDIFNVDTYARPARIALKRGSVLPYAERDLNGVIVEYIVGYGDTSDDVPAPLIRAVKQIAAYLYSHKGDECTPASAIASAGSILDSYRAARI